MKCPNCGRVAYPGSKVCYGCGKELPGNGSAPECGENSAESAKSNRKRTRIISTAAIALAAMLVFGFVYYIYCTDETMSAVNAFTRGDYTASCNDLKFVWLRNADFQKISKQSGIMHACTGDMGLYIAEFSKPRPDQSAEISYLCKMFSQCNAYQQEAEDAGIADRVEEQRLYLAGELSYFNIDEEAAGRLADLAPAGFSAQVQPYLSNQMFEIGDLHVYLKSSRLDLAGSIKNMGDKPCSGVKAIITYYDANNSVIFKDYKYVVGSEGIAPGENKEFTVRAPVNVSVAAVEVRIAGDQGQ